MFITQSNFSKENFNGSQASPFPVAISEHLQEWPQVRLGDIDSHQVDPDDFHEDNHQHHLDDQDGSQVGCFLQEEEPLPPTPLHQVVLLIFSMSMSQCRNWWQSATSQTFF